MSRRFFLAASLVLCLPALLEAQFVPVTPHRSQFGRQQAVMQQVDVSGIIQGVARNGIVISNENRQVFRVAIVPATKVSVGTKVQVTGTAKVSNLRSGLIVELNAELNNRGRIEGKIDTLTVTSLTRERPMGIFPEADGFGGGANNFDRAGKRTAHASRAPIMGRCRIVGRLIVGRGGAMSVQPGRGMLPFELSEQAKVAIDMADMSLVRRGQEVSVKGIRSPRQPNMIEALEVTVKLPEAPDADKPEKAGKVDKAEKVDRKHPPAKPAAKKPARAPKRDKDEGLPEPPAEPAAEK